MGWLGKAKRITHIRKHCDAWLRQDCEQEPHILNASRTEMARDGDATAESGEIATYTKI